MDGDMGVSISVPGARISACLDGCNGKMESCTTEPEPRKRVEGYLSLCCRIKL